EEDWEPAREPGGRIRDGAQIVEITDLVNLEGWPTGTRLIVRRERPHPGAQLSLFDTIEGFRHTAFITDTTGDDLAALDLRHPRRGRAEQTIRATKACGLARFPFDGAANNDRWMQLTFTANDLLCWARRISLTGPCDGPPPRPSVTGSSTSPPTPAPAGSASMPPGPGPETSSTPSTASRHASRRRHPPCRSGRPSTPDSEPATGNPG